MDKLLKKIREHLEGMDNKKHIVNLFIIILISIIILIGTSIFKDNNKSSPSPVIKEKPEEYNSYVQVDYSNYLESKLTKILGKLNGVGAVNVMITLEDSIEKIPATNITKSSEQTTETDSEGGKRDSLREDSSTQIVNTSSDGSIVVLKEVNPSIKGVIVVADGAEDPLILEVLYEAVKTVLGVSGNKVNVYSSK